MIKVENGDLEINGQNIDILAEFLMIYKYLEKDYASHNLNFRSVLITLIFDTEFEKLKTKEERGKIVNFEDIKGGIKNDTK